MPSNEWKGEILRLDMLLLIQTIIIIFFKDTWEGIGNEEVLITL